MVDFYDIIQMIKNKMHISEKGKKTLSVATFIVVGILILLFGSWQIKNSIFSPLAQPKSNKSISIDTAKLKANSNSNNNNLSLEEKIKLQEVDTDRDGLSDYDEKFTYNTSIYLDDTDSDGISDRDEVRAGSDPNCPKGALCELVNKVATNESIAGSNTSNINSNSNATNLATNGNINSSPTNESLASVLGQLTPDDLRGLLKSAGVSDDVVSQLDDQTLKDIYQETLQSGDLQQGLSQLGTNATSNGTGQGLTNQASQLTEKNPADYTIDEIRQLLILSGVDSAYANSLSEEDLRGILEGALNLVP